MTLFGIGAYEKEDYEEILKISEDKDQMDETWEEWKSNKDRTKLELEKYGMKVVDIIVKPMELMKYCRERGLSINGKSRSRYVTEKVEEKYGK